MARARGLFILLTAARAASAHAWEYAAPPATAFFAHAASSGAPAAAAARGLCTHAAASGAPAAAARGLCTRAAAASRAYSTHAAASAAPAATSRGHIGSALAPVGVVGSGGRGIPTRQLAYGVLAAYVMLTCAPITEWDLVDEDMQALYSEYIDPRSRMVMPMPKGRRPPSAQEVRANTEMLKRISRQMNELMKVQKEGSREMQKEHADSYWNLLEDFVNKAKSVLSMVSTAKEFYALVSSTLLGSILLYNNHGDPVQYFVCPFSDYSEVVGIFLFTVTPKDGTQQADGSSGCSENSKGPIHFSTCEVYGKTFGIFLSFHKETGFFALTEDELPCIFGPIVKQRWSYVCAKQLVESLIFGKDNDPEFSWIGPRMDFIPGVCVPRVFACFDNVCDNFVGMHSLEDPVSAQHYCGEYARSMLDMTLTSKPLGWNPLRTLKCLLDKVLTYQHKTYKDSVTSQALASS